MGATLHWVSHGYCPGIWPLISWRLDKLASLSIVWKNLKIPKKCFLWITKTNRIICQLVTMASISRIIENYYVIFWCSNVVQHFTIIGCNLTFMSSKFDQPNTLNTITVVCSSWSERTHSFNDYTPSLVISFILFFLLLIFPDGWKTSRT